MRTIKVFGGGAAQGLVEELRASFESATGLAIDGVFSAVGAMRARIVAGEPTDVVILTRALIAELARDGHTTALSTSDVGTVDTAIAVRGGDTLPPVGDAAQLRNALLAADAIHFPDPQQATAGIHFAKVLRDLGIWDELADRLKPASIYTAAIGARTQVPAEAARLVALLTGNAGRASRRRLGFV